MGREKPQEAPELQVSAPAPVSAGRRPSRGPLGVTHSAQNEFKRWYAAGQNYHYAVANWLALRNGEEDAAAPELSKHSFIGLPGASSSQRGRVVAARCLAFTPPASAPTSAAPSTQTSPLRRDPDARTAGCLLAGAALEEGTSCRPSSHAGLPPSGSHVRNVLRKLEAATGQLRLSCNEERMEEARRRLRPQASAPARGGHDVADGAAAPAALASRSSLPQRPSWMPAAGMQDRAADLLSSLNVDRSAVSITQRSNSSSTAGSGHSDDCRSGYGSGGKSASSSAGGSHADSIERSWAAAGASLERDTRAQQLASLGTEPNRVSFDSSGCSRSSSGGGGGGGDGGGCNSSASSPRSTQLLASHRRHKSGWQQQPEASAGDGVSCSISTARCVLPHVNRALDRLSLGRRLTSQTSQGDTLASVWRPGLGSTAVGEESTAILGNAPQCTTNRTEDSEEGVRISLGGAWQIQNAATPAELAAVTAATSESATQTSLGSDMATASPVLPPGSPTACCTPTRHTPSSFAATSDCEACGRDSPRAALSPTNCVQPAVLELIQHGLGTGAVPVTPMPAAPLQPLLRSNSDADTGAGAGAGSDCTVAAPSQPPLPCASEGVVPAEGAVGAPTPPRQPSPSRRRRAEAVPVLEPHDLFLAQLLASPQSSAPPTPASRHGPDTGGSSIWTWGRTLASLGRRRKLWGAAPEENANAAVTGVGGEVAAASAGAMGVAAAGGCEAQAVPSDPSIIADLLPRFGSEAVLGRPRGAGGAPAQPSHAHGQHDADAWGLMARAASMSSAARSATATCSAAAALPVQQQLRASVDRRRLGGGLAGSPTSQHPLLGGHQAAEPPPPPPPPPRPWRGWSFRPPQRLAALMAGGAGGQLQYDLDVLRELEQGWSSQCAMQ
ncbi:hypothetical protein HYH02_003334 [Chlamydomonas schloesseri]|uniref:Uncharacterized protein n=1 Tax=Chlamydomonas schloesseri TaxID=2026947 RepID=A0A835WTK4_9CHLO|nr:hypothetical protein HYH02_003334 [Chlamydomonas schloesseri]|eukprot:KAG2452310.1 hypothetical protein HYH02_003334 [Chlamydomonas schloesseri]